MQETYVNAAIEDSNKMNYFSLSRYQKGFDHDNNNVNLVNDACNLERTKSLITFYAMRASFVVCVIFVKL
jgi:hypothetical protein